MREGSTAITKVTAALRLKRSSFRPQGGICCLPGSATASAARSPATRRQSTERFRENRWRGAYFQSSDVKKNCFTPCRRQDFVQAFISGSSMTLVPCCILTHTRAHLFSSAAWHSQRQHKPPRSSIGAGRVAPVNSNEPRTTTKIADTNFFVMLGCQTLWHSEDSASAAQSAGVCYILLSAAKIGQITVVTDCNSVKLVCPKDHPARKCDVCRCRRPLTGLSASPGSGQLISANTTTNAGDLGKPRNFSTARSWVLIFLLTPRLVPSPAVPPRRSLWRGQPHRA